MRVLFSPAYQLELDPKQAKILEPYAPLGTLYAASYLREKGHEVFLSDSMLASGHREYQSDLERFRPDLVAIYEDNFNYLSKMCLTNMREAALEKARLAKKAGAWVVVNGSDATDHLDLYLGADVDFAILGEGEETLAELASELSSGGETTRISQVQGLAFLRRDGGILKTPPRGFIKALDSLPFPAWDLVDVARYRGAWLKRHDYFSISMVTTRGCPYHCNWCAKPIYGQRYNMRSPANVAQEMAWLKRDVKPDHIWFADDIFGLHPKWVEEFASEVEALDCATPFKIQARVDLINEKGARALASAGCESVWVGAESGSQKILDAMEKGTSIEQIFEATRLLRAQGIRICYFLQFGYPGEGWPDIEKTLDLVREARPDDIGISISYPLPGTPFYDRVKEELEAKTNWSHSDDLDLMFRGTYVPEFYRTLYSVVHREFRLRKELANCRSPASLLRVVRHAFGLVTGSLRLKVLSRRENPALRAA